MYVYVAAKPRYLDPSAAPSPSRTPCVSCRATLAALGALSTPAPPNGWIKDIRHGLSTFVIHDISFHYVILRCIILHHMIKDIA